MINTLKIYEELAQTMDDAAARRLASVLGVIYEDLQNTVTKTEFNALHVIVQKLAEVQERTGQAVSELTEAQKRTEQRVDTLAVRMEELAEAQKRTEQRVDGYPGGADGGAGRGAETNDSDTRQLEPRSR